jgi:type II secretory pathway component PulF
MTAIPIPTPAELHDATRQLALLARLGYPLSEGLQAMGETSPWLAGVGESLARGDTLTQAVSRHPRVFSPFYAAMVEAAEASEQPAGLMARLSEWLERSDSIRRRVRNALFHPWLVLNCLGLQLLAMLVLVVPGVLIPLAGAGGRPLPPTLSGLLESGLVPAFLLVALVALNLAVLRDGPATAAVSSWLPWAGPLRQLADQALWARALGSLLAAGVELPRALRQAGSVALMPSVHQELDRVGERVDRGSTLAEALAESPLLDSHLAWSAAAGDEREELACQMLDAAESLDQQVERRTEHSLRMAGPWALGAVGVLVALGLVAFWAPFYNSLGALP